MEKGKRKWCACDKKLACRIIKRDTTEPSKIIRVLKPLGNLFIPCRVSLVGYIRRSRTFSSDSRGLAASPGRRYMTPGRIYLISRIYPAFIGFQSRGSCPGRTYTTPGQIYLTYQIYPTLIGF
jgi:hypothetical protein